MEKKTSVPIFLFFQYSKKEMFFDPSFKESYNYLIIRYLYIIYIGKGRKCTLEKLIGRFGIGRYDNV